MSWAHSGNGGTGHLATEVLQVASGIDVLKVPYKGAQAAMKDLLGGQVQVMPATIGNALPHVKTSKLRALASKQCARLLPEVMTVAEQGCAGYAGYEAPGPLSLLAPAKTPAAIVNRIQAEIAAMVKVPEMQATMDAHGIEPVASTSAE